MMMMMMMMMKMMMMYLQLFDSILLTLPRQTTSISGKSPSDSVLELSYDIQHKLPNVYNLEMVQSAHSFVLCKT